VICDGLSALGIAVVVGTATDPRLSARGADSIFSSHIHRSSERKALIPAATDLGRCVAALSVTYPATCLAVSDDQLPWHPWPSLPACKARKGRTWDR